MELKKYYDEVMKQASAKAEEEVVAKQIEETKTAEAIELLGDQEFETEKDAQEAVQKIIEDDYAEKVSAICEEFKNDKVEFDNEEQKVASAMEIVNGWEKVAFRGESTEKETKKTAADLLSKK